MLSLTSDYAAGTGDPSPYIRAIGEAGFTHTHWCHQWNTDFLYSKWEIEQIGLWLEEAGVKLLDLHASHGNEKSWVSEKEYERLSGVELVKNRIDMTATLGGDVIILHHTSVPGPPPLKKSLDELEDFARKHSVRIALENGSFDSIEWALEHYDADYVGVCYDCGHGNMVDDGLDRLDKIKDRLISVHLHDNDGVSDQHQPPFMGTVDWPRLAQIIAASSYTKCVSMESATRAAGLDTEEEFLKMCFENGTRFSEMIEEARKNL